ncbi:uncharacterized protein PGTG_09499 [Puccinia graminis f. sp. tritici CRL 75-36-700-3]|uniref:Uncharacterized protein n=1 Tax=Puccinia graminis f. sp. tritici (strain CRL 75-36-700-3 / race SCCL) TaxID=418459 RepID=E3KHL1_PUCGT|nr:uncharacterized protein PGTG_09499 [Puccinia graminis f. sp. tritici CRL 75-36-700-3]EFP83786.2 hypothetical protein PGTG_09499 [Puccinia graminis f. sp. tritici CRL 75-36-700-3]
MALPRPEDSGVPDAVELELEAYNAQLENPPRQCPINLDYILYLQRLAIDRPAMGCPNSLTWEEIGPEPLPTPMILDLQSMTWKRFQALVLAHLCKDSPELHKFLVGRNHAQEIVWLASINGHRFYAVSCEVPIKGSLDFLQFAAAAYKAYPSAVLFKLVMKDPSVTHGPKAPISPKEQVLRSLNNIVGCILSGNTYSAGATTILINPDDPRRRMQISLAAVIDWAQAIRLKNPGVDYTHPPDNANYRWVDWTSRKRAASSQSIPPSKRNLMDASAIMSMAARVKSVGFNKPGADTAADAGADTATDEISSTRKTPLPPASAALEKHHMETYLRVSHIGQDDQLTRARLLLHGITHWTFFRSSSEPELTQLGFPLGIARLLCEGVGRLERYEADMSRFSTLSAAGPSGSQMDY